MKVFVGVLTFSLVSTSTGQRYQLGGKKAWKYGSKQYDLVKDADSHDLTWQRDDQTECWSGTGEYTRRTVFCDVECLREYGDDADCSGPWYCSSTKICQQYNHPSGRQMVDPVWPDCSTPRPNQAANSRFSSSRERRGGHRPAAAGRLSFKLRAPRPQASSSRRARTTRSASRRSLRPGKMASCSLRAASMSKSTRAPSNTRAPASNPRPHAVEIRTTIATTSTTRVTPPPVAAHPRSGSRCSSRSGRSLRKWTL